MRIYISFLVIFHFCGCLLSQSETNPHLPFSISDAQIRPLRQLVDADLQKRLEERISRNPQWDNLVKRKKMAVALVDLSDSLHVKFARVNGAVMIYAASLPKLAVMLAVYEAFEEGSLEEKPEILSDIRKMIAKSSNNAATRLIDRLSFEKISAVLVDPKYKLYDPELGGGLWVGKRYGHQGRRYPDPIKGLVHAASVTQVCRFYYLLAMGKLVSWERSRQMLNMLTNPELHHKFVNTYDRIVPNARIYRKSGTWKQWHSDSALVWGPVWRRYILATLVEDPAGERICRNLVPAIEEVLQSESTRVSGVSEE